jgi:ubiquitin-like protein Nedd8
MNINIKLLTGKIINVHIEPTNTITQIKEKVQEMEGIQPEQQRLTLKGSMLSNESKIEDLEIKSESILHMVLALRGGSNRLDHYSEEFEGSVFTVSPIILNNLDNSNNMSSNLVEHSSDDILYDIRFSEQSNASNKKTDMNDKEQLECSFCLIL